MSEIQGPQIDRRTIVRTAAWGVPVATMVAASPAFADSLAACPVVASNPGAFNATAAVSNNVGSIGLGGLLSIDASSVPTGLFVDGFAFVVNSAALTMSNNVTYPATISGGAGVATSSLVPVPLPSGIVVNNVPFASGTYGNTGLTNNFRPQAVQANVTMTFVTLTGPSIQCTYNLTWPVGTMVGAGIVTEVLPFVGGGNGVINYTGTVTSANGGLV